MSFQGKFDALQFFILILSGLIVFKSTVIHV